VYWEDELAELQAGGSTVVRQWHCGSLPATVGLAKMRAKGQSVNAERGEVGIHEVWLESNTSVARGFTLVELLVVVAVIAVLAALLLLALVRAKDKSHRAVCLSNERQLCLGFNIKADDFQGRFHTPELAEWFNGEAGRQGRPWVCPDAPVVVEPAAYYYGAGTVWGTVRSAWMFTNWPTSTDRPAKAEPIRAGSYTHNFWVVDNMPWVLPHHAPEFLSENDIRRADCTPVLFDGPGLFTNPQVSWGAPRDLVNPTYPGSETSIMLAIPRHGTRPSPVPRNWPSTLPLRGAVNVAFYDGHVELVKLDWLWQLYWHIKWMPPPKAGATLNSPRKRHYPS
jgi:prepilin-type N-terminal cleavage/methylation domain-containing protein/prepilin-type processing-associated H-X9-DG protein